MAYLGRQPIIGNYQVLDALTATATDTYALTKGGVAVFPQTPANCIVSLNGVIQAPFSSYNISGSNIVFDSALTGSDSIDFITVLGDVLNVGTVSDGTIGLAKLSATGTKDATTFLRGDNTFQTIGANTPAFEATLSSQSVTNATTNKLSLSTEVFDTDSCYDNVTNYRFTPTTAGKYFVYGQAFYEETGNVNRLYNSTLNIYFNGSAITNGTQTFTSNNATYSTTQSISFHATINMNGSTDYLELFSYVQVSSGTPVIKNGRFGAYKLIE
jgi:hypothetical protein